MSQVVTVICRHNQARSVMAAAAISKLFPDLSVSSAGIKAVEGQRIPQSILKLADVWGLDVRDVRSHSLQAVKEQLVTSDFVVVAEDEFIASIVDIGVAPHKILSMQDQCFENALIPFDPIGQGGHVVSIEIAKAIMTTLQLVRAEEGFGRNYPVQAIFTYDENDFREKLDLTWTQASANNGVVILGDFRAPNYHAASQFCKYLLELKVGRSDRTISLTDDAGRGALERAIDSQKPFAISGRFEVDQVEKFALSVPFFGLINQLAASRPVWILTEPAGMGPCAYLMAANASLQPNFN